MTAILRYDAACRAIAEAKSFDEVKDWIDKAAAVREYGRRIHNRQIEIDAIEIRVRAKRRRGELLREFEVAGKLRRGPVEKVTDEVPIHRVTLEELEVSKNESSEEQAIAKIDGSSFERLVARCRAYTEANPKLHAFNVLKPPPEGGPVNGARAIMGSRIESDESLDYSPTPPWATRALIERVLPELGAKRDIERQTAWEPACGEGHMAEVLSEYFKEVAASDIHDYGYGRAQIDFLDEDAERYSGADWIITNPPFKEKAEQFALYAIDRARIGVAIFARLQWLETIGRYERLFRDHPPTLLAFFCERVNLCMGRWEPDGGTATAYMWLVWIKGLAPHAPFWIPPGQQKALTRADDAERFTAHPVIKAQVPLPPHDPATGEIIAPPTSDGRSPVGAEPAVEDLPSPAAGSEELIDVPKFLVRENVE